MGELRTAPHVTVIPPFVLPDQHGVAFSTAPLRGRRNLVLMLLPNLQSEAQSFIASYTGRREEWAWLHTAVLVIVPDEADVSAVATIDVPVLRDSGAVRAALLPGVDAITAVVIVADTGGHVTEWRTARRISSLPDADTVLTWAWEVARPRGACDGGVPWARPEVTEVPPAVPIGHFTIGARRTGQSRFARTRRNHDAER